MPSVYHLSGTIPAFGVIDGHISGPDVLYDPDYDPGISSLPLCTVKIVIPTLAAVASTVISWFPPVGGVGSFFTHFETTGASSTGTPAPLNPAVFSDVATHPTGTFGPSTLIAGGVILPLQTTPLDVTPNTTFLPVAYTSLIGDTLTPLDVDGTVTFYTDTGWTVGAVALGAGSAL